MADGPVGFTEAGARRIAAATKRMEELQLPLRAGTSFADIRQPLLEGRLIGRLSAPSAINDAPSASLQVYRGAGTDWSPGDVVTVINRHPGWSAASGTQLVCVEVNGEWRPIVGSPLVNSTGGGSAFNGCAPWVCQYMPGSLVDVPGIGSAPRQYQFAMPLTCDCCGGNAAGEPVTLDWIEGTNKWESASFLCDLAAACGTQTYRWTIPGVPQDPGYSEWRTRRGEVCGFEAWIWNDGTHGGGARWVRSASCTGGCEASTAPPSPGAVNGQIEFRECGSWEWYMVGEHCQCGATVVGPTAPPTSANESISVIIACTGGECTGEAGSWVAVGDTCACGTSAPPSEPGARDGVEVIVACTLTDAGYTASARWRLTVDTDTFMELVTDDETIVLRYQLDKRKTWCPLCQNAMEWVAPCGPHSCSGWLQAICVSPYFPALTCEDFNPLPMEYSFGIDSISNDEFASDPAWSAFDLEAMNGAWTAGLERLGAPDDAYYVTCADFGLGLFGPLFVYRSASVLIRTFSELNEGTGHTDVQRWYGYWRLYVCCLSDGNGYAVRYYQLHMNYDTSIETVSGTTWTRGRFGPLFYGLPNCPPGTDTGTDNCNGEIPPGSTSVDLFRDHIGPGSTTIEMVE